MVGGPTSKARTQYISALIPPSTGAKLEQFESGYGSENSASDDSSKRRRIRTARSQKHHRQTDASTSSTQRPATVLNGIHQRDSIERNNVKRHQQLNSDPIGNYRRLKTANTRISIDAIPFQAFIPNQKVIRILLDFHFIFHSLTKE
jgi:hypothetical protein